MAEQRRRTRGDRAASREQQVRRSQESRGQAGTRPRTAGTSERRAGGATRRSGATRATARTAGASARAAGTSSAARRGRARNSRAAREAAARRRRNTTILGIVTLAVCLVAIVFAVRGIAGCVSRVFAPKPKAQETTPEVAEETTAAPAEPVRINLAMIGDILQHSGVYNSGMRDDGTRNYDHIFAHISGVLADADIKVVNQETILGGESLGFSGYPTFNGPQEMGDAEVAAGFNVALRATNHAMDYGYTGLHNEMSYWHTNHPEMAVIGAVDPEDTGKTADDAYYIFEKDGFTVALLNYTYDLNGFEDPQGCVSILEEERVRRTVSAADAQADMVVVFPHWGEEYNLEPVQSQYDMAQVFLDAGADVIIGGHPHVIEPVEVLTASDGRKVPCFWSVGNFVSTQIDNENLVGGVARVTLEKDADGVCRVTAASFEPTITHKGTSSDMTTYLLRDYNDDLAASNYLVANDTDNRTLTVAWANEFCTQVLGSGFDTTAEILTIAPSELEPGAPSASAGTQIGSPDAQTGTLTSVDGDGAGELDDAELDEAA